MASTECASPPRVSSGRGPGCNSSGRVATALHGPPQAKGRAPGDSCTSSAQEQPGFHRQTRTGPWVGPEMDL